MAEITSEVNASCLDLLLNELVPLAIRSTRDSKQIQEQVIESLIPQIQIKDEDTGDVTIFESELLNSEDVNHKIEQYGYSVGLRLSEVLIYKDSQNEILKNLELLSIMKFICRDVWKVIYQKQMDNLRTNHRGTFVLIDNGFKMFQRFDSPTDQEDTMKKSKPYLWIPCGIIRGVLKSFGVDSLVTPEVTKYPAVSFNIQTNM
jgi:hypothetical protein